MNRAVVRISGRADAVEWEEGRPVPVEYKNCADEPPTNIVAQLALQMLCLEEMHSCAVSLGYIFRTTERRRITVELDPERRNWVSNGVLAFRAGLKAGMTGFGCRKQPGCAACIYRSHCWPEEYPHV